MNKVIITGRLGADPIEHEGEKGKFVTYSLANTEWTKNGEMTPEMIDEFCKDLPFR